MKPLNLIVGASFLIAVAAANAAPFLTCKPYPPGETQPHEFLLYFDGATVPIITPAIKNVDGSVQMKYDLAGLGLGKHTVKAQARNSWEDSDYSLPFDFTAGKALAPGAFSISRN